jgi:hypothetical protein
MRTSLGLSITALKAGASVEGRIEEGRLVGCRGSMYKRVGIAGISVVVVRDILMEGSEDDGDWFSVVGVNCSG